MTDNSVIEKKMTADFQWFTVWGIKVHIFWEGHKIWRNLHRRFDCYYIGQIFGGDFAKICGLLRMYELYQNKFRSEPNSRKTHQNVDNKIRQASHSIRVAKKFCMQDQVYWARSTSSNNKLAFVLLSWNKCKKSKLNKDEILDFSAAWFSFIPVLRSHYEFK